MDPRGANQVTLDLGGGHHTPQRTERHLQNGAKFGNLSTLAHHGDLRGILKTLQHL